MSDRGVAFEPMATDRTPIDLVGWVVELLEHATDLAVALPPGGPLPVRVRVHLAGCVLDASGGPLGAWVSDGRRAYVGPPPAGEALDALAAFAEASAVAAGPLDATTLEVRVGESVTAAARGTVAAARLIGIAERSAWSAVARIGGRRRRDPARFASEALMAAAGLTLVPVAVAVGLTSRVAAAAAPRLPDVAMDGDAGSSLVAHVLAEAVPDLLGHALVRTALLGSPVSLVVAVRLHGHAASLEVGQGHVRVSDGIRPDALAVIDGPLDSLVDVAVASVTRQVRDRPTP